MRVQILPPLMLFAAPLAIMAQETEPATESAIAAPRAVAGKLAETMGSDFVYPETGVKYAAMLRANAASGKYDRLSGAALGEALTTDLLAVYADGHVRVVAGGDGPSAAARGPRPGSAVPHIEQARWLAPGIAFVRFNEFPGEKANVEAVAKFAADFAGAKTVIFDIRTNGGGGIEEMDALFPHLFVKPTPLVRMATRRSVFEREGSPFGEVASLRKVEGDPAFVTHEHWATPVDDGRLRKAKVYVLTSTRTGSAAEHFALAMKGSGRATLVGTRTGGANHFGGMEDLGHGFSAFIPVGRTFDPRTGKDWEGTGVTPDIETAPEDALKTVLMREGVSATDAGRLSTEVAPAKPMVRRAKPSKSPTP